MAIYGYARVSTEDQSCEPQRAALLAAGVGERDIREEVVSGGTAATARPVLGALLRDLSPGDVLVTARVDRLGRDPGDVLSVVKTLGERGVTARFLDLGADTSTPAGQLVLGVLAAVAGWERALIRERTREGLRVARKAGRVGGRRPALTANQIEHAIRLQDEGKSLREIARLLGGRYGTPAASSVARSLARAREMQVAKPRRVG